MYCMWAENFIAHSKASWGHLGGNLVLGAVGSSLTCTVFSASVEAANGLHRPEPSDLTEARVQLYGNRNLPIYLPLRLERAEQLFAICILIFNFVYRQ